MKNIHEFIIPYTKEYKERIFWANDVHLDSKYCKRKKFFEHCEMSDKIILSGDFWDLMEGKFDRRASKKDELLKDGHYINNLVDLGIKMLKPYKDKIIAWNKGNHELTFEKFSDVSITDFVCKGLGINPVRMGANGYYMFKFVNRGKVRIKTVFFTHNTGHGGKRSKGALAADIIAGERPDADIWIGEHSHRGVIVPLKVQRISKKTKLINYQRKYFCQSLTYKAADEDVKGESFEINKAFGMLPIGGLFLDFYHKSDDINYMVTVTPE
jgi:hypothetical protein